MLTPAVLGTAGFLQDLGSKEGAFISPGVHLFNSDVPPAPMLCPPLARAHGSWLEACPLGPDCSWLRRGQSVPGGLSLG